MAEERKPIMANENHTARKTTFMEARFHPSFWMDSFSWTDRIYYNEGLIKTHNPEFCISRLQSTFRSAFGIDIINLTRQGSKSQNVVASDKSYIFINYPDNDLSDKYCDGIYSKIELGVYKIGLFVYDVCDDAKTRQEEFMDSIDLVCRFCGLFISNKGILATSDSGHIFKFILEPKFSDRDFELNRCSDIKFLYHVTTDAKVDKILKNGLNPKSSNAMFRYPDRIYLGLDPEMLECQLLPNLRKTKGKVNVDATYSILKVDISKIPSKNRFKVDPNYPDGVFTSDNIPPSAIEVFKNGII